jgi:hypothetical protein
VNRRLATLTWALAALLCFSSALNLLLVFQQAMVHNDLTKLSTKINRGNQMQALGQSVINDLSAYGKSNPAIYPLLKKYGVAVPAEVNTAPSPSPSKTQTGGRNAGPSASPKAAPSKR